MFKIIIAVVVTAAACFVGGYLFATRNDEVRELSKQMTVEHSTLIKDHVELKADHVKIETKIDNANKKLDLLLDAIIHNQRLRSSNNESIYLN
jgi:hypothetical protein